MDAKTSNRRNDWHTVAIIVLLLIGMYVGGYFVLGDSDVRRTPNFNVIRREFEYVELKYGFGAMGWIEAKIRGDWVVVCGPGTAEWYSPRW